jgi:hypothetical protein
MTTTGKKIIKFFFLFFYIQSLHSFRTIIICVNVSLRKKNVVWLKQRTKIKPLDISNRFCLCRRKQIIRSLSLIFLYKSQIFVFIMWFHKTKEKYNRNMKCLLQSWMKNLTCCLVEREKYWMNKTRGGKVMSLVNTSSYLIWCVEVPGVQWKYTKCDNPKDKF